MELIRVSLPERIEAARKGRTRQPEYLPCLVQQWAKMPIQAYFGTCKAELERLYHLLGLVSEDTPTYQTVAMMIFDLLYTDHEKGTATMELLVAPVRLVWEQVQKRRNRHDQ